MFLTHLIQLDLYSYLYDKIFIELSLTVEPGFLTVAAGERRRSLSNLQRQSKILVLLSVMTR